MTLKKYLVFIASFAVLFMLFQIASGMLLTVLHTPDPTAINGAIGNEVVFGGTGTSSLFTIGIFLMGTVAYFIAQKINRTPKVQEN